MGDGRITQRNRLFRAANHAVCRQQQVSAAIGNARRRRGLIGGGQANMAHHRAALLRQPRHVQDQRRLAVQMCCHAQKCADGQNAAAAHPGHGDVPRPVQHGQHRFGQARDVGQSGHMPGQPRTPHRHECRTKAFEAAEILVAGRLVDHPLAAKFRLQRFNGDAVRLFGTIAAAFADRRIDEHPLVGVRGLPRLAASAQFGGTGLFIDNRRGARQVT